MATINIDGRVFTGENLQIINGQVIVDGKPVDGTLSGVVEIRIMEGVLNNLTTDASVRCGGVEGDVKAGGSVQCDHVGGDVSAGGSVQCDGVDGNVRAGGSVSCDDIGGSVTASVVKRG